MKPNYSYFDKNGATVIGSGENNQLTLTLEELRQIEAFAGEAHRELQDRFLKEVPSFPRFGREDLSLEQARAKAEQIAKKEEHFKASAKLERKFGQLTFSADFGGYVTVSDGKNVVTLTGGSWESERRANEFNERVAITQAVNSTLADKVKEFLGKAL